MAIEANMDGYAWQKKAKVSSDNSCTCRENTQRAQLGLKVFCCKEIMIRTAKRSSPLSKLLILKYRKMSNHAVHTMFANKNKVLYNLSNFIIWNTLIYKSNYSASTVNDITLAFKQEKKTKLGIYCSSKHITLGAVHSNLLLGKNLLFSTLQ